MWYIWEGHASQLDQLSPGTTREHTLKVSLILNNFTALREIPCTKMGEYCWE